METEKSIEEILRTPKTVETEAGRIEYISPGDAIKLAEYKKKEAKSPVERIKFIKTRPAAVWEYNR